MKNTIIFLLGVLLLGSCGKDELPPNGKLTVTVKYTGASNMAVDNVIVTLNRKGETAERGSLRIDKSGTQTFDLPAGEYELKLEGNRCVSKDLSAILINAGKTTIRDINIEQLPSTMVIRYNDIEYKSGDTITLGSAAALDIWNKHSKKDLHWNIRAYSQTPWISFEEPTDGTIAGGGMMSVVFSIDKSQMENIVVNYADVILTANDNNSFTVRVAT